MERKDLVSEVLEPKGSQETEQSGYMTGVVLPTEATDYLFDQARRGLDDGDQHDTTVVAEPDPDGDINRAIRKLSPVPLSSTPLKGAPFTLLEQWLGVVEEVRDETFIARLQSMDDSIPEEEAEIEREEVSPSERGFLEPGAEFYWSIGYHDSPSRQRVRASHIRFRRLPRWTGDELKQAEKSAQELLQKFGWS